MKLVNHYMNIIEKKVGRDSIKIKEFIYSPKVVFDIGANVGMYSLFFAKYWPESKIYAFEPVEDTYNILLKNIELNNFSNIKAFNYGLHSSSFIEDMGIPEDRESENVGLYTLSKDVKLKDFTTCSFKKVSDIIKDLRIERIDLIKIDCEGSELPILSSGNILDITRYIHMEFNDFFEDTFKLKELLLTKNYEHIKTTRKQNQLWKNKEIEYV